MIEFVFDQTFEVSDSYIRREKVVIIIYIWLDLTRNQHTNFFYRIDFGFY